MISSSILPFSQSIKSSVAVGDMGLVGAVVGGVAGPEAIGIVEQQLYEMASGIRQELK